MNMRKLCLCFAWMVLLCGCTKANPSSQPIASTTYVSESIATATTADALTTSSTDTTATGILTTTTTFQSAQSTVSQTSANSISRTNTTASSTTAGTATDSPLPSTSSITTVTSATTPPTSDQPTTFKATVRDNINNRPVSGVVVSVWISLDVVVGSATTDKNGVALIPVPKCSAYRVTLTLPQGYEAEPEYRFATTTVNITIRKAAVQNELDHSQAQYGVGKTMTDFSLTDTDGNRYRLSELLKEKKLVVLDFWYTTCEPCKLEFPFFEAAIQKYGDDMALLAIDPIDSLRAITTLRNQLNAKPSTAVSFPMLKDTCNLSLGFDVITYPVTVFINSDGRIMEIHDGAFMSQSDFLATVQKYLG